MLVFRNSSSYERYWGGRTALQQIVNNVRNLVRSFLVCGPLVDETDRGETEKVVKTLVAILYAVKNHLRGNWDAAAFQPEFATLMPRGFRGHEADGVGLPMELAFVVERYIKRVCVISTRSASG
jgi:putative membrane protein